MVLAWPRHGVAVRNGSVQRHRAPCSAHRAGHLGGFECISRLIDLSACWTAGCKCPGRVYGKQPCKKGGRLDAVWPQYRHCGLKPSGVVCVGLRLSSGCSAPSPFGLCATTVCDRVQSAGLSLANSASQLVQQLVPYLCLPLREGGRESFLSSPRQPAA